MTDKDQKITPTGQVELNEKELDQATGGTNTLGFVGEMDRDDKVGGLPDKNSFKVEISGVRKK